jgi:hypothetical protein
VFGFPKLPRSRQVLAGVVAVGALTIVLWLGGWVDSAGRLVAYAVVLLALGQAGLAAGAIGVYQEQREVARQHADQVDRARIADVAQVEIERLSGPGELVTISMRNASSRAIRNVYVWADVRGVAGHYAAGIPAQDARSRHMIYVPRDDDLHWRLRAIKPGADALFTQLTHMDPNPVPAVADADITAFAEFLDAEGTWWRCDEDGTVTKRQPGEPPPAAAGSRHAQRAAAGDAPQPQPHRRELTGRRDLLHSARFAGRVVRRNRSGYSDVP